MTPLNLLADAKRDTRLMTREETASRLDVEAVTLDKWRSNKRYKLAYVKIGGKVRYPVWAVEQFVAERTVMPGAPQPEPVHAKRRYTRRAK
jgi:hypothetical protein